MFQQTIAIGNLGNDPEARCTPTGKWVTHFNLAVNERYGERETTTWFRVEAWGKLGELCQQYLAKGRLVTPALRACAVWSSAASARVRSPARTARPAAR